MGDYLLYPNDPASTAAAVLNEKLVKENVEDSLINKFPDDMPLQLMLGSEATPQFWGEQPVDTLGGVSRLASSMALTSSSSELAVKQEFSAASFVDTQYARKIRFVTEIHQDSFAVSGTSRAADTYGFADRFRLEAEKVAKKQLLDLELRMWHASGTSPQGTVISAAGVESLIGATYAARQTQGILPWICRGGLERGAGLTANVYNSHGELLRDGATNDYRTWAHNANGLALDATMWNQKLISPWSQIAKGVTTDNVAFMGYKTKLLFRTFAHVSAGSLNTRTISADAKRIVDGIDYYDTDGGTTKVMYSYYLNIPSRTTTFTMTTGSVAAIWDESVVVINPQYYKIMRYRPQSMEMLGKTHDGDKAMWTMEAGLKCSHPFAGAAIVNCVASIS